MALYIVVRHPGAPQKWRNYWDGERLLEIETDAQVAERCRTALNDGLPVFVHRCGHMDTKAKVCGSVRVAKVDQVGQEMFSVSFADQMPLNLVPSYTPEQGQNCYDA